MEDLDKMNKVDVAYNEMKNNQEEMYSSITTGDYPYFF